MWTQPIKTRIDMLATSIKMPVGIKVAGEDIPTLERIGEELEKTLRPVEGTKSVYSERVMGALFSTFWWTDGRPRATGSAPAPCRTSFSRRSAGGQ